MPREILEVLCCWGAFLLGACSWGAWIPNGGRKTLLTAATDEPTRTKQERTRWKKGVTRNMFFAG